MHIFEMCPQGAVAADGIAGYRLAVAHVDECMCPILCQGFFLQVTLCA